MLHSPILLALTQPDIDIGTPSLDTGTPSLDTGTPAVTGHTFAQIVDNIVVIVNHYIIPTMFALAFLFFLAGVARYLIIGQAQGDEESKEKGKHLALAGIIGFVVLFGIWGIINLLLQLLTSLGGVSAH